MSNLFYKPEFLKDYVSGGPKQDRWAEILPKDTRELWTSKFLNFKNDEFKPNANHRLLNNFMIGSDPEFVFVHGGDRHKTSAIAVGLKVGLAAGADQNERLGELRPYPSTYVAEHLASILVTLRWMYLVNSASSSFNWRAGAWYDADGIGGHIHFGRKRPNRIEEIRGLNGLALMLARLGLFPMTEWHTRMGGDSRGQLYGRFGDIRTQLHGYEYRTLPSWLNSPIIAYICLAASKLVIFDPDVTIPWADIIEKDENPLVRLRGLAKLYKGRDDDAAILYHILGQPNRWTGDPVSRSFKAAWGIPTAEMLAVTGFEHYILPDSIEPTKTEVVEIEDHLLQERPLTFSQPVPNFVYTIPPTYTWLPSVIQPARRAGFGDLIHNVVTGKGVPNLRIEYLADQQKVAVSPRMWVYWNIKEREYFQNEIEGKIENAWDGYVVGFPRTWCIPPGIKKARHFLFDSGLLPAWRVKEVQEDSLLAWIHLHSDKKTTKKIIKTYHKSGRNL